MTPQEILEIINRLLERLGNVDLETAKTWAEVEENAQSLRKEGHENE
jgi:hypothetical protein